ncbi:G2/M phase-specific E3 ubiquitin-protein ligase-like [Alosa sapidissima]|uniref:G2/M phase-specific E3 ubiquitin-protein ligase-like n=1 Tax=Alosa sapidissima TaxID=34773 RepID=UPI001C0A13A7|nr:G2/M phase-specific E3 ubiquitin-protein ligase-like [Alosa sapidissima]
MIEGLQTFGLVEAIRRNPAEEIFINSSRPLKATEIIELFVPTLSPRGGNQRREENRTLGFWRDWLVNVEGGLCAPVTLEMVLVFTSGLDSLPPLGFDTTPSLQFHNSQRPLPVANTWMNCGIVQAPTFGLV